MHRSTNARTRCRPAHLALAAAASVIALLGGPRPADAAPTVTARGAALSSSASCSQGDIEIDYVATGAERQVTDFTASDGSVLHHYDVEVYSPDHEDVEYILSQTRTPPPAGSLVAVHVTIGSAPPTAASGEFFVAYTCDSLPNGQGGTNTVVAICYGSYGTCPRTAGNSSIPSAVVVPRFTG